MMVLINFVVAVLFFFSGVFFACVSIAIKEDNTEEKKIKRRKPLYDFDLEDAL